MAARTVITNKALYLLATGGLHVETADVRVLLLAGQALGDGIFSKDHNTVADVIAAGGVEAVGTGYSRKQVASRTATEDDTSDWVKVAFATVTWSGLTVTNGSGWVGAAVLYLEGASDAARPVLQITDDGLPIITNGGSFDMKCPSGWWLLRQKPAGA